MMSRTTPHNPGHHGGWRAVTRQTLQKEAEETQVVPGITEDSNSQMETSGKNHATSVQTAGNMLLHGSIFWEALCLATTRC